MAKPRSSHPPARKWSSSTMILTMLIIFTLLALGLGIFYIPSSDVRNSPKPNDLTSIAHNVVARVRKSSGTFLPRGLDKIIRDIEKRIAYFTFIPVGLF